MLVNEALTRQAFLSKIPFKNGDVSLSKDLKVKLMSMRIDLNKVRKLFDDDGREFINGVSPENFAVLLQKADKTEDEMKELQSMMDKINSEYNDYINKRLAEDIDIKKIDITADEFNEIVSIIDDEEIRINDNTFSMADFLEIVYALFVKED